MRCGGYAIFASLHELFLISSSGYDLGEGGVSWIRLWPQCKIIEAIPLFNIGEVMLIHHLFKNLRINCDETGVRNEGGT